MNMSMNQLIWGFPSNLHEYGIDNELERRIKKYLVDNVDDADNSTVLAEMCMNEFDFEYEENHPVHEWAIKIWNFINGEED